jgi:hypothetical protein
MSHNLLNFYKSKLDATENDIDHYTTSEVCCVIVLCLPLSFRLTRVIILFPTVLVVAMILVVLAVVSTVPRYLVFILRNFYAIF